MNLLLIEDNLAMQTALQRSFERRGIHVTSCGDGAQALERWRECRPDVVLLDLSLPGRDGLEVLSDARAENLSTPVIILTARGTVGDRILGLNIGADDYLPKPFDLDELEARVRALARRRRGAGTAPTAASALPQQVVETPSFCGLRADHESGAIYHMGLALELPPREAALLRALLARPGQAVAKERLSSLVFGDAVDVQPDAIEVVAYRLRKKLSTTQARLVTLRGLGYLLKAEP
ncbi:response regulator transcription factor [Paucibacter sp. KCTC 42545]|uniref:response regulator transcription factor n=1 Tax=Paucibacter sp. KCTC 42545 TaxID=1768242 RepID=UPI000733A394|nr:response regulator transcription factor [Paucibacter sp. KCTC 42545]ALT77832.1 two-component system response regulator [Paucibacter sp. KCTC 42545]